jgi:hypothetical protein
MKKNDVILLISVILYSYLFYDQAAGLNFLIFNCAVLALLLYRNMELLRTRNWLIVAAGALVSAACIYVYSSPLAITANIISLAILSAISLRPGTSYLISIFLYICAAGSSFVFMIIDGVNRKSKEVIGKYKRPLYVRFLLIILPLIVALIFFFFYQSANPLFYDLTKDINLDFISIGWLFFTFAGFLLMYAFFYNRFIPGISDLDEKISLDLNKEQAARPTFLNKLLRLDTEYSSAMILFSMLNILLLIVNILDLNYLWFDGKLPAGIKHKEFVHNGVGALISSIISAILIILFYFRGTLNFYEKGKWIRMLAYLWILQNAFMIFSTAYRNNLYIMESGLSYKKIGVYVYLLLTLVGLATTFIKVLRLKSNWYLFRVNAAVSYYVLVLSCIPNWDVLITDFNIRKYSEEKKELEKYLILDLSFKNLPQLYMLPEDLAAKDDLKARDYYYALRGTYFTSFLEGRDEKLYNFLADLKEEGWQSRCIEKQRVYQDLYAMRSRIKTFRFMQHYQRSLEPIFIFSDLEKLQMSNNFEVKLKELSHFEKLQELNLAGCNLDSLTGFPPLKELRMLDLSNNNIRDLKPLAGLKKLEVLNLSGYNTIHSYAPLLSLPSLKVLIIGNITKDGLNTLQKTFPHVQINATVINN